MKTTNFKIKTYWNKKHKEERIILDPETAAHLLSISTNPRKRISRINVLKYAKTMKAGLWQTRSKAICVREEKGQLYLDDGFTRATGVLKTGVTIEQILKRNLSRAELKATDRGVTRNVADSLGYGRLERGVAAGMIDYDNSNSDTFSKLADFEVENFIEQYKDSIDFTCALPFKTKTPKDMPFLGLIARAHTSGVDPQELHDFVSLLRNVNEEAGSKPKRLVIAKARELLAEYRSGCGPINRERSSVVEWILFRWLNRKPWKKVPRNILDHTTSFPLNEEEE